jgi:3-dehydroquinate dehydratase/shikimate dehydrogenase
MNNGKLCIPICTSSTDEMRQKIGSLDGNADMIELRLDCLDDVLDDALDPLAKFNLKPNIILTLRPSGQGGHKNLDLEQRKRFWSSIHSNCSADLEEDVVESIGDSIYPKICSFHDFSDTVPDISAIYRRISKTPADVVKIAVKTADILDTIKIWNVLLQARSDRRPIIPIAMGEVGKWTRILSLAHGAYLTYASLDADGGTAPGQITAHDMMEVFRVKELGEKTEVYGIIAGDTSYSMSPYIHNAAFKSARLNSVFVPLQVSDLDGFVTRMVRQATREIELNFRGFSVTNPHKQTIMHHLDDVDDAAAKIGAVNTVKIEDGKLRGYNTDAAGFLKPLLEKFPHLKNARAAVIGAGGAARACIYSLKNAGAEVTVFARDLNKARDLANDFEINIEKLEIASKPAADFSDFDIVVNATPTGTRGDTINETVATAEQLNGVKLVYDLIYNPTETRLIHEARRAGAETLGGFDMLLAQAERQFQIWTGGEAPIKEMRAAAQRKIDES